MTRRVVLIAGPPGSGKTTRARALAEQDGLRVYDRDDDQWAGEREFRAALAALSLDPDARAAVVRSCATRSAWLEAVALVNPTSTELLDVSAHVCRQRIARDIRATQRRLAGVGAWWAEHAADPWAPPPVTLSPSKRWVNRPGF